MIYAIHSDYLSLDELSEQKTLEDKSVYGVENSSTFLECSPKSQRALTYWQFQPSPDERKQEVGDSSTLLCSHYRVLALVVLFTVISQV